MRIQKAIISGALILLSSYAIASTPAAHNISPKQAIAMLKEGNAQFIADAMKSPRTKQERRDEIHHSQNPFVAIIACSDSRVPVEIIFDQGIGDIFTIRTAGNSVNGDLVMGSVDYAIDHLNVPLVVVLGHENCGGVTSAISVPEGDHKGGHEEHHGKIGELLNIITEDIKPYVGHPEKVDEAIRVHAQAQVDRIKEVQYINKLIESGDLKVISAYLNIHSGLVTFNE